VAVARCIDKEPLVPDYRTPMASPPRASIDGSPPSGQDLLRRLEEVTEALARSKARAHRLEERMGELERDRDDLRRKMKEIQNRSAARRRSNLTPDVLEDLLQARVRHRPVLALDGEAAKAREQRFADASESYRTVVSDNAVRTAPLERVEISGVPWWIPRDERSEGRVERLREHGFPLRAILQTREVALGGIMLDLGANIGRTSATRMLLGDVRGVYAAEPEPINYACLVQNVVEHGLRGFVLPDRIAIGATRGEVQLRRSRYIGGHRVVYGSAKESTDIIPVPLWPVDEWIEHVGIEADAVTFVKVDTQGAEVGVLRGASSLLERRQAAWQVEVDPDLLSRAGTSVGDLLGLLERHFTHFIDLFSGAGGPRVRPIQEAREALSYIGEQQNKTDLLLYSAVR
jgi:FkbM family methyltransferase